MRALSICRRRTAALSTCASPRAVEQIPRDLAADSALHDAIVRGGYWHVPPHAATKVVIAFSGVVAPEAIAAQRSLGASAALLQVTSYDRLTNEWKERRGGSYVTELLRGIPRGARLVTVLDGHPSAPLPPPRSAKRRPVRNRGACACIGPPSLGSEASTATR